MNSDNVAGPARWADPRVDPSCSIWFELELPSVILFHRASCERWQRRVVRMNMTGVAVPRGPIAVRITRIADRLLDPATLAQACKAVRTELAALLGERVRRWLFANERTTKVRAHYAYLHRGPVRYRRFWRPAYSVRLDFVGIR